MKALLVLVLLVLATSAHAQQLVWQQSFGDGNQFGSGVVQTAEGGFIGGGGAFRYDTNGVQRSRAVFVRMSESGARVWEKEVSDYHYAHVTNIFPLSSNRYIAVGLGKRDTAAGEQYRVWTGVIDEEGTLVSENLLGDSVAGFFISRCRPTDDGGFIVAGTVGTTHMGAMKLDAEGRLVWLRAYQPIQPVESTNRVVNGNGVRQMSNGDFVLVGLTVSPPNAFSDVTLMRLSSQGDSLWCHIYATPDVDRGIDVIERTDGGLLTVGFREERPRHNQPTSLRFIRTAADGTYQSTIEHDPSRITRVYAVERLTGGDLIMAGTSGDDPQDLYVLRTDDDGQIRGQSVYAPEIASGSGSLGYQIAPLADGGCVIAGRGGLGILMTRLSAITSAVEEARPLPKIMGIW